MPQIIIRGRDGGSSARTIDSSNVEFPKVLVIVTPNQVEVYTDDDAVEKLVSGI